MPMNEEVLALMWGTRRSSRNDGLAKGSRAIAAQKVINMLVDRIVRLAAFSKPAEQRSR